MMKSEDTERSKHLLAFLSAPRHFASFDALLKDNGLFRVLTSIDSSFSESLAVGHPACFLTYLQLVEGYIIDVIGKRLKRRFRQKLFQGKSIQGLCQLILYLCVHCRSKKTFITQILALDTQAQGVLMNVIDDLNEEMYSVEVNQILEKIDLLEEENQNLDNQLRHSKSLYQELQDQYGILQKELEESEKECDANRKEKLETLRELNVSTMEDYVEVYQRLQSEYRDVVKCLNRTEQKQRNLNTDAWNYKAKILEDSNLITHLYQQISSLKSICRNLRTSNSLNPEVDCFSPIPTSILKENRVFSNTIEIQTPKRPVKNNKFLYEPTEDLEDEVLKLRHENGQLTKRTQAYHQIMESQKEVITTYKDDLMKLKKSNQIRKWKLQELQLIHTDLSKIVRGRINDTF